MSPKSGFFYGWWIVIACTIIQIYLAGTFIQGFSAIFNPIVNDFRWSYTVVSLAFSLRGFESGAMAPIIGILADKFEPRKLLITGVLISGTGFYLFSQIQNLWSFYCTFLFLALGLSLSTGIVAMTLVVRWFGIKSGLAMGILTSGFGASGFLMPSMILLIDNLGWRQSTIIFAVGTGILCLPLALIVKNPPTKILSITTNLTQRSKKHVIGKEPIAKEVNSTTNSKDVYTNIIKSKTFWLLSLALFFGGLAGTAIIVHQIPYMVSIGISRQTAAFFVIIFSASSVVGRLFFGYIGDRVGKRYCFVASIAIKAVGVLGFALSNTTSQFVPSLLALGIGFGGLIPLRPALQVEFFGTRFFATIQGFLMISVTIGSILSPIYAGWIFDLTKSYRPAFTTLALATLLAIPMLLYAYKSYLTSTLHKRPRPS